MAIVDPYDELPYRSLPIEWTAPERLALASLLHGGPRTPREDYTVLELGCADGANLLPMAYHRRHSTFVGVDGAHSQVDVANSAKARLRLSNVDFIHADFITADAQLDGQFDYIIGHGVFSWVRDEVRDALLRLCAKRLRRGGLLYLNYNANPGWKVRGMVRDFLLAQTAPVTDLCARARAAQTVAARVVSSLTAGDAPYSKLIASEFAFICESDLSYVAHEYLATDNHAYWRSEFMTLVRAHALEFVADADFNYSSGRTPEDLVPRLVKEEITGQAVDDTVDLLCYRQLHSPILTQCSVVRQSPSVEEFSGLVVASCLVPCGLNGDGNPMFRHPSGYQVEAKEEVIHSGFLRLHPLWPHGLPAAAAFHDVGRVMDDLKLLHRNGLIELRYVDANECGSCLEPLKTLEAGRGGYFTTPYHTRVAAVA